MTEFPSYGVRIADAAATPLDEAAETIRRLGYAVVPSGLSNEELAELSRRFNVLQAAENASPRGPLRREAGEQDILRCPLARDPAFLRTARDPAVLALCERLIGPAFILNQQNGVLNPGAGGSYSQSRWHRDLPYQHFVSSRPLALNALFCLDPFDASTGATWVLPASHLQEAFPSPPVLAAQRLQVSAPAGSFLVLDCMTWHAGGNNVSGRDRRAINHVYTIAQMRQQIDLPALLGDGYTQDASLRQLLGYQAPLPRSVEEWLEAQAAKRR